MALRRVAAAVFVITALLLQVSVLNRLGLPGAQPNLAIVVVLALVLVEGPGPGMVYAFLAGLLADLLSTHTVGRLALVWTVVAFVAGFAPLSDRDGERPVVVPTMVIAVLSGVATLAYAVLDVVSGSPHEALRRIVEQAAAVGAYALVLGPLVLVFTGAALRRLQAVQA